MDAKTVEYMESRTKSYRKLENEATQLKRCKEYLCRQSGLRVGTNHDTSDFKGQSEIYLKAAIGKAIDERIAYIQKEMEEI